jgi:transketolase
MIHAVQSGHPGGSLGCVDLLTALYYEVMDHDPGFNKEGKNEDILFVSNGHISAAWYSALARSGYFQKEELGTFRKLGTRLQGHPSTHEGLPGIRVASGSLGQGLSVACGAALGKKLDNDKNTVYVLMGDGELQEGQIWEAAMSAAHYKLDNLIGIVDWNGQQIDGSNEDVISLGDLRAKWKSFGWKVFETDGNDIELLINTLNKAKTWTVDHKPVVILMKTEMGFGVDFMMGSHKWHGIPPNDEQLEIALQQLPETIGDY